MHTHKAQSKVSALLMARLQCIELDNIEQWVHVLSAIFMWNMSQRMWRTACDGPAPLLCQWSQTKHSELWSLFIQCSAMAIEGSWVACSNLCLWWDHIFDAQEWFKRPWLGSANPMFFVRATGWIMRWVHMSGPDRLDRSKQHIAWEHKSEDETMTKQQSNCSHDNNDSKLVLARWHTNNSVHNSAGSSKQTDSHCSQLIHATRVIALQQRPRVAGMDSSVVRN